MTTLGIDLGTTNSCVAYFDGVSAVTLDIVDGARIMPSAVAVRDGNVFAGDAAIEAGRSPSAAFYRYFKRQMGRLWNPAENQGEQMVEGSDGPPSDPDRRWSAYAGPDGATYLPQQLSAVVIERLVQAAKKRLGNDAITGAVITVPAGFGDLARRATIDAGHRAGLANVVILDEPTAAATAYATLAKKFTTIPVVDCGGGTTDVAIIEAGKGVIHVRATRSAILGGVDFDHILAGYAARKFHAETGIDIEHRQSTMMRLMVEAERVKKLLSESQTATFNLQRVDSTDGLKHLIFDISRAEFEALVETRIADIVKVCDGAMKASGLELNQLDGVLLVGGLTAMPAIRNAVYRYFRQEPSSTINPHEVVAMGAALHGAMLDGRLSARIEDIAATSVGIEVTDNHVHVIAARGALLSAAEKELTLTNCAEGQEAISINLVEGNDIDARKCDVLFRGWVPIEPGPVRSAKVTIHVSRGEGGLVRVRHGETILYGDAA